MTGPGDRAVLDSFPAPPPRVASILLGVLTGAAGQRDSGRCCGQEGS